MSEKSKAYESYEMLAKLLNSQKKENIDRAYDALSSALKQTNETKTEQLKDDYYDKRNSLAQMRKKAEKYMAYFTAGNGYEGSGMASDAAIKAETGYVSDLSALDRQQLSDEKELLTEYGRSDNENEAKRAGEKAEADGELAGQLYEIKKDADTTEQKERELESENYWKQKEYELKKAASAETDNGDSSAVKSYRSMLYNSVREKFAQAENASQMQDVYDTVTGVNTEQASAVFGEDLYKTLVKEMSDKLSKQKTQEKYDGKVRELYNIFAEAKEEHHNETYLRLYRDIVYGNFPGYTKKQLDDAYDAYKKNAF